MKALFTTVLLVSIGLGCDASDPPGGPPFHSSGEDDVWLAPDGGSPVPPTAGWVDDDSPGLDESDGGLPEPFPDPNDPGPPGRSDPYGTPPVDDPEACHGMNSERVCHRPPGNRDNAHEICIGWPAVPAHLAHGDHLGRCDQPSESAP